MGGRGQKLERTETTWKRLCRNSTVTAIRRDWISSPSLKRINIYE